MLAPWILAPGRALLAIALGLVITFTTGHTARFGLVAFGVFAVLSGLLLLAASIGPRAPVDGRTGLRAQAAISLVAGIAALVQTGGGVGYLILLLSGWAIVTGALELVGGLRFRGVAGWADRVIAGALTILLGAVVLVIPPDLAQPFSGDNGIQGLVTSGIVVVGVLGAWAVVTGVLQAIGAASARLAAGRTGRTAEASR